MIYTRKLYSLVADLGMSSATRAQAKNTYVVEDAMIARARQDVSWWQELCRDYCTVKNGVIGRHISQVGMMIDDQEPLTLEMTSDMSGGGLGAHWKRTTLWATHQWQKTSPGQARHNKNLHIIRIRRGGGYLDVLADFSTDMGSQIPRPPA